MRVFRAYAILIAFCGMGVFVIVSGEFRDDSGRGEVIFDTIDALTGILGQGIVGYGLIVLGFVLSGLWLRYGHDR